MNIKDKELIERAKDRLKKGYKEPFYTAATALRTESGEIITAMNAHHYSGFLCAEMSALNLAFEQSAGKLDTIVCVKYRGKPKKPEIINACGKCRQILLEFAPELKVIVVDGKQVLKKSISDLLPYPYIQTSTIKVWNES
jgi:cytidine deaminase